MTSNPAGINCAWIPNTPCTDTGTFVQGSTVILKGTVRSFAEREEAEREAWAAPGVTAVENRIAIAP